jgi:hypothetical protein
MVKSARGPPVMRNISPLLVMPVLVIAVSIPLYLTGAWILGASQGFTPAPQLAQAVLFVVCVAWYGRAGLGPSLVGGAVLLVATSALSLANFFISTQILANIPIGVRMGPSVLIGLINSVLYVAVIMAIGARLCTALRQPHLWIIALTVYPIFSLVVTSALPVFLVFQPPNRDTMTAAIFATTVVKGIAVFSCLGAWVARPAPDVSSVFN